MTDKNPEVLACDASIMKNVWEIRLREYGQKLKLEQERMEKSALTRINEDWAKRMSGKVKERRVERKAKPPEESPAQIYKPKPAALGRPNGFVSSRPQKPVDLKKDTAKRNKLTLLLNLNEKQPGLMVWTKSWKFSQPLLQPEQIPPASDWGQSWKLLNIQPNNEGKSWMEGEHDINVTNNKMTFDGDQISWEKVDKALVSQIFEENMAIPDWEKSWKYTKQKKESHGPNDSKQENLYMFHQSHVYNEERSSSDWNESWKSSKPPKDDNIMFVSKSVSKEGNDKEEEVPSTIPWGQSWKHFKKQLHMKYKSTSPAWVDSWRISKPASQISQPEIVPKISEPQTNMPEEPLDPKTYQTIMDSSKEEKYRSSLIQTKDMPLPVTEWQKSWMTIKNLSEYKEQPIEKLREEKTKLPMQGQEMKKEGSDGPKPAEFEVLPFLKKCKPLEMTAVSVHKDKGSFISRWKDSWKALKNQRRQDRILSRQHRTSLQSPAAIAQTSLNEWANSWRFTNLIANQNSDLWQQGWSTYSRNRPDRWVRENQALNEGLSHNGPTWARGWAESWRSTRHQHRAEKEATHTTHPPSQPADTMSHRTEQTLSDWDESWQFSTNQFHHDRPSATEWTGSWRFCNFHCENCTELQSEPKQWELKSMEIKARKELPCPSRGFSRSIESQIFKERFSPQEWNNSWKMFDEKKKPKSGFPHPIGIEFLQSWDNSWRLSTSQFYQSESMDSSPIQHHSMANAVQYESMSEWGSLWKIANPQPPKSIALWSEAERSTCSPKRMIFSLRYKCGKYPCPPVSKDYAKNWGNAWRFMKLESQIDMKSVITSHLKCEDDSVIMKMIIKKKKPLYSQTDKEAPQEKRWVDACKLAKTQPRPKCDVRHTPGQENDEGDKAMFAEWAESWRFTSNLKSDEPVKMSVSLADWEDSWKFFLRPYSPKNGPKKIKGRS